MLDALTLDQLRVLVAVVDTGSFSAAARRLQRVQSAISQSVAALEGTLRLQLFDRSGRLPRLTEAGLALTEDARRVIEGAEGLRARAEAIVGGVEPSLTIAVDHFLPRGPGVRALRDFGARFPDLSLTLLSEGASTVERHLRDGTADIAVFPFEMASADGLDAEFLVDIEMVPVVAASHPLAREDRVLTRADLAPHVQLILTDGGASSGWSRGVLGRRLWRFAHLNTRRGFLLEGFGWCFMPADFIRADIDSGAVRRLRIAGGDPFHIRLHSVRLRGRAPGIAARWLTERLRSVLAEPVSDGSSRQASIAEDGRGPPGSGH